VHARPGHLERREHEAPQHLVRAGDLELGPAIAVGARQHHVHSQPTAALGDEVLLGGRHHLRRRLARSVCLVPELEAALVDPHRVAHRLELGLALDGAGQVELDVEADEIEAVESREVAHGHDVVEAVDADALPAGVPRVRSDVLAGPCVEHLLERCRAVLADVARLRREDDERVAVSRDDDVRVAVHDLEAGDVRDSALEAAVLVAGDDQGVRARARPSRP
jgi:hypothetical protein